MIFLSDEERAQLRLQHKRERDKRVCDRIKAVLLFDKDWSIASIAEALLLSEDAIREHISEYKKSKKLKPEGGGSVEKLWAEQSKKLEEHLQCHIYLYVKDIVAYVKSTWNITYSVPGRSRINLSGIIDVISHNVLVQEDEMLNAEATIKFFQKIEEAYPCKRKIHLFCDNARYYRNKSVAKFLITSKIILHFLPPYSPNLNPIERLWKWMKERVIYNTYYEKFEDFRLAIFGFFSALPMLDPDSVLGQTFRSRVRDKFRLINSPIQTSV